MWKRSTTYGSDSAVHKYECFYVSKKKSGNALLKRCVGEVLVRRAGAPMGATSAAHPCDCAMTPAILLKTLTLAIFCSAPPLLLTYPGLGCTVPLPGGLGVPRRGAGAEG